MLFSNLWQVAFSFPIISSSPGTSIGQDFVSMVAFLRCSSQAGREGSTPTWCSIGSTDVAHGRPDVVQVWRSEARPRGNAEKDCQLHWLCFNWGPDPGILEKNIILMRTKLGTIKLYAFSEAEWAHEIWQLPEVQFKEQKRSKLVRNFEITGFFFRNQLGGEW